VVRPPRRKLRKFSSIHRATGCTGSPRPASSRLGAGLASPPSGSLSLLRPSPRKDRHFEHGTLQQHPPGMERRGCVARVVGDQCAADLGTALLRCHPHARRDTHHHPRRRATDRPRGHPLPSGARRPRASGDTTGHREPAAHTRSGRPAAAEPAASSNTSQGTFHLCGADTSAAQAIEQLIAGRSFSASLNTTADGCADLSIQATSPVGNGSATSQLSVSLGSGQNLQIQITSQNGATTVSIGTGR